MRAKKIQYNINMHLITSVPIRSARREYVHNVYANAAGLQVVEPWESPNTSLNSRDCIRRKHSMCKEGRYDSETHKRQSRAGHVTGSRLERPTQSVCHQPRNWDGR